MRALAYIYHFAMIAFAVCAILFGVSYALRCVINRSDFIYVACFAAIAVVGYKLMLAPALEEYREFKSSLKDNDNE